VLLQFGELRGRQFSVGPGFKQILELVAAHLPIFPG
jgi:hypothetical protein